MHTKKLSCGALATLLCWAIAFAGASGGTVSGKATYEGTPAKQKMIDMSKEPSCAKQHSTPIMTETVVVGPENGLQNVVVYISSGAPDESSVPGQAVTLDQKGCQYLPHVVPMQVNQELQVLNDDPTSHNIHPLAKINHEWNKAQPPGTSAFSEKFDKPEFIPVKCNVHPWMHTTFAVMKTSHYAVTDENGNFTLPNLPPGKYAITAWHESYGAQTQEVTITGSETKALNFVFKARPY
jgi:Carboxypeptidase regulatory-like domain